MTAQRVRRMRVRLRLRRRTAASLTGSHLHSSSEPSLQALPDPALAASSIHQRGTHLPTPLPVARLLASLAQQRLAQLQLVVQQQARAPRPKGRWWRRVQLQ